MHISSTEPSSNKVVQKIKKWYMYPKVPKQSEVNRDGEINPQNYNFNQFLIDKSAAFFKNYQICLLF